MEIRIGILGLISVESGIFFLYTLGCGSSYGRSLSVGLGDIYVLHSMSTQITCIGYVERYDYYPKDGCVIERFGRDGCLFCIRVV
jgi:hypothetical protein